MPPESCPSWAGTRNKTARIWDAATGREIVLLSGHTELVAWAASHKVDLGAVHRQLNRALGLATDRELVELFKDCEPGALPPLGLAYGIDTILDQSLVDAPDIYFEAGDHQALVHVSGSGYIKLMANALRGQISHHA